MSNASNTLLCYLSSLVFLLPIQASAKPYASSYEEPNSNYRIVRKLKGLAVAKVSREFPKGLRGWAYQLLPVSYEGQDVLETDFTMNGRIIRPMFVRSESDPRVCWAVIRVQSDNSVTLSMTTRTIIYERIVKKSRNSQPTSRSLSATDRDIYLRADYPKDYRTQEFDDYINREGLRKRTEESTTDFVIRLADWFARNQRYITGGAGWGFASMKNGGGECVQLNESFATILRKNGIPARTRTGLIARPFTERNLGHGNTEFWLDGCGWVVSDAVMFSHKEPRPLNVNDVGRDNPIVAVSLNIVADKVLKSGYTLQASKRSFEAFDEKGKFINHNYETTTSSTQTVLSPERFKSPGLLPGDYEKSLPPFDWNAPNESPELEKVILGMNLLSGIVPTLLCDGKACVASLSADDGGYKVNATKVGTMNWQTGMAFVTNRVVDGQKYRLSFDARGSSTIPVCVYPQKADSPFTNGGLDRMIEVDEQWTHYSFDFVAQSATGQSVRIPALFTGTKVGTVWCRNVSLQEIQ